MVVSTWFKNETNLVTMIDLLRIMKEELEKAANNSKGAKCEGVAGSQSSEKTIDKCRCFVFQRTQGGERR